MSASLGDYLDRPRQFWAIMRRWLYALMPKGLYFRSLLIVIVPMVFLQSFVAYFFLERHWTLVTSRLSRALTQDIAALIDIHTSFPGDAGSVTLRRIARDNLDIDAEFRAPEPLPAPLPTPFFSQADRALSQQIAALIRRPFWIDAVGRSSFIEIRIQLEDGVLRVIARRSAASLSNSHIFIIWMLGTSLVLGMVAVAFLRNQIRPILRLAGAAEAFGKGRDSDFRPHGAREVRQAGYAFISMKRRVERAMEQRTAMLNGVSHDLRTVLTRFKLSLALMGEGAELEAMQKDVLEMQRMLEAYLAFARGDALEPAAPVDIHALLTDLKADAERHGHRVKLEFSGDPMVTLRADAFRRCLANLVGNAQRHGDALVLHATRDQRFLTVHIDDDGPGIAAHEREEVFRPFYRLDEARNQDEGGTGLGLAIARDIARSHGGDVSLGESAMGGLRASVRVPV